MVGLFSCRVRDSAEGWDKTDGHKRYLQMETYIIIFD